MKQKVEIEIDIPDGYEATGKFDLHTISQNGVWGWIEFRKVNQWRDPTPADYGKKARFSDDRDNWTICGFGGWSKFENDDDMNWLDQHGGAWRFCQVCDEETK